MLKLFSTLARLIFGIFGFAKTKDEQRTGAALQRGKDAENELEAIARAEAADNDPALRNPDGVRNDPANRNRKK